MQLAESPLTGSQVSSASSQLCRDGQLVRIRAGVYLWADGIHAKRSHPDTGRTDVTHRHRSGEPTSRRRVV